MAAYCLDVLSLSYDAAAPRHSFAVMHAHPLEPVGRLTSYVEINFSFFQPWAFGCLQSLVRPELSRSWGIGFVFPAMCRRTPSGELASIAVLDAMTVVDTLSD